jgi:hypothetical protein
VNCLPSLSFVAFNNFKPPFFMFKHVLFACIALCGFGSLQAQTSLTIYNNTCYSVKITDGLVRSCGLNSSFSAQGPGDIIAAGDFVTYSPDPNGAVPLPGLNYWDVNAGAPGVYNVTCGADVIATLSMTIFDPTTGDSIPAFVSFASPSLLTSHTYPLGCVGGLPFLVTWTSSGVGSPVEVTITY